jgi:hypothetical protein
MAVPPQFIKKAAKRRIDAPVPTNQAGNTKKVSTFRNPGNKAGINQNQQVSSLAKVGAPDPDAGNEVGENFVKPGRGGPTPPASGGTFLDQLKSVAPKKPKTKVQPAAARKVLAMRLAKARNAPSPTSLGQNPGQ